MVMGLHTVAPDDLLALLYTTTNLARALGNSLDQNARPAGRNNASMAKSHRALRRARWSGRAGADWRGARAV